jgi:polyvinyl alcohol dehydrogenase (cytochrome)
MCVRGLANRVSRSRLALLAVVSLVAVSHATASDGVGTGPDWATYGHDSANTRNQPFEHDITTANVSQLAPKWIATTTGDVSATPAVVAGAVYFGDFGGSVWKLDASTGSVIWQDSIPTLTGITGDYARTSASVDVAGNVVVVGTNKTPLLLGLDTTSGALLWKTQVNPDLHGTMTGSPQLVGDTVITGVSAAGASGPNATFRSDIVSVNALTGAINWESYSLPPNGGVPGGYAGATMFSAPAIDVTDNLVFGMFGQPYTEPASVTACNHTAPNGFFSESCEQPGAYWDSIVAFDLTTGEAKWSYRIVGDGPWHSVCDAHPVAWCLPASDTPIAPVGTPGRNFGDAWDMGGSSPNVFTLNGERVVGFGTKTGVYYLFEASSGSPRWNALAGPGGDQGGFEWGTAYDGSRIYVSLTDQHHLPYQLTENGVLTSTTATGGSWAGLDPATGKILWQVADPQTETLPAPVGTVGVWDLGPATVANGVVYGASMAKTGAEMYALDAADGSILWSYSAGSSVNAGPAIVDGSVYWGSGYSRSAEGNGNNRLFAFSIDGIVDTVGPTTTVMLSPSSPNGANGWYKTAVAVSVTATDNTGGVGVYQTRCVVDPAPPPATFADLPAGACGVTGISSDGQHTIFAASEDKDNNAGTIVSATFKIDTTPPTITAAATSSPNPDGWYSGPVTVHFACSDTGSGIPAGACPGDQTLSGVGTAIASTPETVTDAAGNVSAPSNVVTVKIVNATGLCALTAQDVRSSVRYQDHLHPRVVANRLVDLACSALQSSVSARNLVEKNVFIAVYRHVVHVLQAQRWVSAAEASNLSALAGGL